MILVDSSIWIDFLHRTENEHTIYLAQLLPKHRLGLTDLILTEVLQGIRDDKTFHNAQQELADYELFETGGRTIAIEFAKNYRSMPSKNISALKYCTRPCTDRARYPPLK